MAAASAGEVVKTAGNAVGRASPMLLAVSAIRSWITAGRALFSSQPVTCKSNVPFYTDATGK
jgi:hypothetical protein